MAQVTFRTDWCKGCGLCVDACPKGLIRIASDQLNQKALAASISTDQKAAESAPLRNRLQVFKQSGNLVIAANRNVWSTAARYNACGKRCDQGV